MNKLWLNLGKSYIKIGEYQAAIEASARGMKEEPKQPDYYLLCARAYMKLEDFEQAENSCDIGIQYAQAHIGEAWAKKLRKELMAEKSHIENEYQKSKYGTFSS
ncbi:MAG: tetratricopeptide repeat protein [Verrucomicrobia bacterium]|nr:tetratricopeptide repeat protein [Verrucomicrobiota bacterium]MBS0636223.1 tetratricopeptide repeat protein [Verrucomicrobiota bacterium]